MARLGGPGFRSLSPKPTPLPVPPLLDGHQATPAVPCGSRAPTLPQQAAEHEKTGRFPWVRKAEALRIHSLCFPSVKQGWAEAGSGSIQKAGCTTGRKEALTPLPHPCLLTLEAASIGPRQVMEA